MRLSPTLIRSLSDQHWLTGIRTLVDQGVETHQAGKYGLWTFLIRKTPEKNRVLCETLFRGEKVHEQLRVIL